MTAAFSLALGGMLSSAKSINEISAESALFTQADIQLKLMSTGLFIKLNSKLINYLWVKS